MAKTPIDTDDPQFLQRFYSKSRALALTKEEVEVLRQSAEKGDIRARYGYGRWLYYFNPYDGALREAEMHFFETMDELPDSMVAYSQMLRHGETAVTHPPLMDIEQSLKLLELAVLRGCESAEITKARHRIYGNWCDAEPQEVADEIEHRLASHPDSDPVWHCLLAFAHEQLNREDDAIPLYEQAISLGETDAYGYLAITYQIRGNNALYEEYMEEGIRRGATFCCLYQADEEDSYDELDEEGQMQMHQAVAERLLRGLERGDGTCAYYLWFHHCHGSLGFDKDEERAYTYLRRGVELTDSACIPAYLSANEREMLPPSMAMTPYERDVLRLKAARYLPNDKDTLLELKKADDTAFLIEYKEEMEKYWLPAIARLMDEGDDDYEDDDGRYDAWT